ncbi:rho GTPase-activating protein 2-like [Setaria italica]|uniref:rho GTPase-activating protein 2-like n=1 Tax=Setaria italica TaxID=4555 RepID=UPI000BE6157C|nr:rho GTPase-activating protein 2-like [Setaria italica]
MEIGWPTDVRHVAHVTFDRLHGFRGVPEELQREVEGRPPSASTTVLGVSTESMQCSYDGRGNSVLTILLHLQRRLYDQRAASPRRASSGSPPTEPRSSARGTSSTTPASFRTASTCIAWQGWLRSKFCGTSILGSTDPEEYILWEEQMEELLSLEKISKRFRSKASYYGVS